MSNLSQTERLRFDRGVKHLHQLGDRALVEFLLALSTSIGGRPAILQLLTEYEARLNPNLLQATGGHRMPSRRPRAVPADLGRASA